MASVQYLFSHTKELKIEIDEKKIIFEWLNKFRNLCACVIQKTWRGYASRKKFMKKKWAIVTIQSYYRGWVVRKNKLKYIQQHEADMDLLRRNRAATIIQAAYRSYLVRKYMRMHGGTPAERVKRLKEMNAASVKMQDFIRNLFAENAKLMKEAQDTVVKKEILFYLFKWHHLIRTTEIEGIYSCHCSKKLSFIEELMKIFPFKKYMDKVRKCYEDQVKSETITYFFKSKELRKIEDMLRNRNKDRELRPEPLQPFIDKRFNFDARVPHEYATSMFLEDQFMKRIENILRDEENKDLNISSKSFDTDCLHLDLNDRTLPYFIDYFETHKCHIHYPPLFDI